ncbi:unnamed protein product [Polarella glacialis]|uniref:Uncharacterized protein n=1 Tax=Polarella glacialis TaxID=89957 RepID=A0A813DHA7_POLGL|nr:unnamed protein product [Polarella glacialis]
MHRLSHDLSCMYAACLSTAIFPKYSSRAQNLHDLSATYMLKPSVMHVACSSAAGVQNSAVGQGQANWSRHRRIQEDSAENQLRPGTCCRKFRRSPCTELWRPASRAKGFFRPLRLRLSERQLPAAEPCPLAL